MQLIVGGAGQGKLDYVLARTGLPEDAVFEDPARANGKTIFNHLEGWVRAALDRGEDPWETLARLADTHPALIVLCDEVGCGVVPMDKGERRWREAVGRLCCRLAREADSVTRIFCGLPTSLKGEFSWN